MEIKAINVLFDFCLMSMLMFIAKIIRAKVKFIQKLYIPSALLAGFMGLFLGSQFLNVFPFSKEISSYAGLLIAILFATMFLGNKKKTSFKKMFRNVGDTFLINFNAEVMQYGVFILIGIVILPLIFKDINIAFGLMVPAGFIGGHGSAAAIGGALAEGGWEEATSIGQTFATIGLLAGIIIGVIYINIATRKKYTEVVKDAKSLPNEMLCGLVPIDKRKELGLETVNSMSIDSLTWHICLILVSVGLAYLINYGLKLAIPQISFPVYAIALICSIILQGILKLFKLDDYVDKKTVTHIGSSATDYLVAFGVASINISIVAKYWVPILVLSILAIVFVSILLFVICRKFFGTYWFERGIYLFGMCTGVMATGVILLRIVDPDFKTGVLEDYGFAWVFLSFMDIIMVSFSPLLIMSGNGIIWASCCIILAIIALVICYFVFRRKDKFDSAKVEEITPEKTIDN